MVCRLLIIIILTGLITNNLFFIQKKRDSLKHVKNPLTKKDNENIKLCVGKAYNTILSIIRGVYVLLSPDRPELVNRKAVSKLQGLYAQTLYREMKSRPNINAGESDEKTIIVL